MDVIDSGLSEAEDIMLFIDSAVTKSPAEKSCDVERSGIYFTYLVVFL